jgi:putative DNA primase/helicase
MDAQSIDPVSVSMFDRDRLLLNCQNGTLDLRTFGLRPHSSTDLITKMARVKFDHKARCLRWEQFIIEVMLGDKDTAVYLQKAMGYSLTGLTEYEVFFILYGATSRNGKTTLTETVAHILGDYAMTIQPQTLSRRSSDGGAASPDLARLKGARLVNMPEPEKGLELNSALVKQLTGGDTYTGRHLREDPFEFTPEFNLFINTNHLPRASDDTVFASGRVKIIPFERHFRIDEQDTGLKQFFRRIENKSGILNWLIMGYRLMLEVGFDAPERVTAAVAEYREEADVIGGFLNEYTVESENGRIATTDLYAYYVEWAKANGYKPLSNRSFTMDMHRRYELRRDSVNGRAIIGLAMKK